METSPSDPNLKSDVEAKEAFANELRFRGYQQVQIKASPADTIGERADLVHYFEIKFTRREDHYFGAATLTEWEAALRYPDNFWFVVAWRVKDVWNFREYTPAEFMNFSSIPPFKIFFNVPIGVTPARKKGRAGNAVRLTSERLQRLAELYRQFKSEGRHNHGVE